MVPKKDVLANLDLSSLYVKREEAVKKQRETAEDVELGKVRHLLLFLTTAGAIVLVAIYLTPVLHEDDLAGMLMLALAAVTCIAAFFPNLRPLQDRADAANRVVKDIEREIAFCHQVLEEVRAVRVRKYAEIWVQRELS